MKRGPTGGAESGRVFCARFTSCFPSQSADFKTHNDDPFCFKQLLTGTEDPKFAPGIVGVAVWAFHGAKDQNVPVAGSRGMIEAMRKSGQKPKYTEYPNEGHNIWYQVSTTPGLWDWLFAQKRD